MRRKMQDKTRQEISSIIYSKSRTFNVNVLVKLICISFLPSIYTSSMPKLIKCNFMQNYNNNYIIMSFD